MLDVVIIGSGPSGLSSAIYTKRAGLYTVVITGESKGGMLLSTESIDNYLGFPNASGEGLAKNMLNHVYLSGVPLVETNVIALEKKEDYWEVYLKNKDVLLTKSVIYAAGSKPKKLPQIEESLETYVSYCATCDGQMSADEKVAVVGGGNSAVEDALYLSRIADSVDLLVRRELTASSTSIQALKNCPNVTIHKNTSILSAEETSNNELKLFLSSGKELEVYSLFVAIGQNPCIELIQNYVETDSDGFVSSVKNEYGSLFVTGDLKNRDYRQAIIAAGDGAKEGMNCSDYVRLLDLQVD